MVPIRRQPGARGDSGDAGYCKEMLTAAARCPCAVAERRTEQVVELTGHLAIYDSLGQRRFRF